MARPSTCQQLDVFDVLNNFDSLIVILDPGGVLLQTKDIVLFKVSHHDFHSNKLQIINILGIIDFLKIERP